MKDYTDTNTVLRDYMTVADRARAFDLNKPIDSKPSTLAKWIIIGVLFTLGTFFWYYGTTWLYGIN